jgi:hypothetical protein
LSSEPSGSDEEPTKQSEQGTSFKGVLGHPLAVTAFSVLAASLLIPALTNQWQDRQKARDLKTDLATSTDELTTRAVIAARINIDRRFREAQATDARKEELERASGPQRQRARTAYRVAVEKERDAVAASNIELFEEWLVTRSVIRSKLAAYFPGSTLAAEWEEYANHVTFYIRLASSASTRLFKREYIKELAAFLNESPERWIALENDPRHLSPDAYGAYVVADGRLSDSVLRAKNDLVRRVLDAHIAGFSTNWSDLLKDLVPVYG